MEWDALELAQKHERELRERLERRVERLEERENLRALLILLMGIAIGAGVEYLPRIVELMK